MQVTNLFDKHLSYHIVYFGNFSMISNVSLNLFYAVECEHYTCYCKAMIHKNHTRNNVIVTWQERLIVVKIGIFTLITLTEL